MGAVMLKSYGWLAKDCKGFVMASQNMPDWVMSRSEKV